MKIHLFVVSLAFVLLLTGCSPKDPHNPGFVVAEGKGFKIYRRDLDEEKNVLVMRNLVSPNLNELQKAQVDQRILDQMIRVHVVKNLAGTPPPEVLTQAKQQVEKMKADPNFSKRAQTLGLNLAKMEQDIQDELTIKNFLDKEFTKSSKSQPSETEAKAYYDANPNNFQIPELAQARCIMVKVPSDADTKTVAEKRKKIEDARSRILTKKEKIEDLAKTVSEDISASSGGLTPKMAHFQGQTDSPFIKALWGQAVNEVGPIFTIQIPASSFQKATTEFEFLQVVEKTAAHKMPFETVRDKIIASLSQTNKNTFFMKYMADIGTKAEVKILLPSPIPTVKTPTPLGANKIVPPVPPQVVPKS